MITHIRRAAVAAVWAVTDVLLSRGLYVPVILLGMEALLLSQAGDILVVGPNPLRIRLSDLLERAPGVDGSQAMQIAGVILDFKKWIVYCCFGAQLWNTNDLLKNQLVSTPMPCERRGQIESVFRWQGRKDWVLGLLCVVLVSLFYWRAFLVPSMTGHVWGPVGRGLLGHSWPWFQGHQEAALVAYRLWYLVLLVPLFWATAFTIPGYVRLLLQSPEVARLDDQDPATVVAAAESLLLVPVLGILGVLLLALISDWLGAGGLQGVAGGTAYLALALLAIWLLVGTRYLAAVQLPREGSKVRRWRMLLRTKSWSVAVGGALLVLGGWLIRLSTATSDVMPIRCETRVLEAAGAYYSYRLDKIREVRTAANSATDQMLRRSGIEVWIQATTKRQDRVLTQEEQRRYLLVTIVARGLLWDLCATDPQVRAVVEEQLVAQDNEVSTAEDWAWSVDLSAAAKVVDGALDLNHKLPRDYDRQYLLGNRRARIRKMLADIVDAGGRPAALVVRGSEKTADGPGPGSAHSPDVFVAAARTAAMAIMMKERVHG